MKYILLFFMLYLPYNLAIAEEKPITEIIIDPFADFYPHLGNSICRKKAFEIAFDSRIDKNKTIELWKNYETICSVDGSYQLILADFYIGDGGHYKEAKEVLEKTIYSANYDTKHHKSLLHNAYKDLDEKSKAMDLAKKMINDYPNWYRGYEALGSDFIEVKDWSNAKKYLEKALKMYDLDPATYLLLASVSYELKEDDKVIKYYHKAFLLDPCRPFLDWRSSAAAVAVYIYKGRFEDAKEILRLQQEFNPDIVKEKRFIAVKEYYENSLKKSKR
jgi:tetratricopeptide (TPR) repeat protein